MADRLPSVYLGGSNFRLHGCGPDQALYDVWCWRPSADWDVDARDSGRRRL